jgi:hypothetical protein
VEKKPSHPELDGYPPHCSPGSGSSAALPLTSRPRSTTSFSRSIRQSQNDPIGSRQTPPASSSPACIGTRFFATPEISPGNTHSPPHLWPSDIRPWFPYKTWTLKIWAFLSPTFDSYPLPDRRSSALPPTSFRSRLTAGTLVGQLCSSPCRACSLL